MRRNLIGVLFLLFIHQTLAAQTDIVNTDAAKVDYSESNPYKPREFAVKKKSKPKKEKESKKDKQASGETTIAADLPPKTDETVTIPVSVFDTSGRFVTNLKQSDFKVFADGKEQEVLSMVKRDEPINLILLIDTSPSTALRIEEIQNYALAIVERLKPDDKVMVIEFNQDSKLLTDLTANRQIITKAVRKADFGDGTSLYEAVEKTFRKHVSRISGRTAIVLMTDGVDTTSFKSSYAASLLAAEKMDTPVFPVYFDTFDSSSKTVKKSNTILPGILGRGIPFGTQGSTAAEYETGRMYLLDISALSGGRTRIVKNIADARAENVDNIGGELRAQYQISFRPSDFAASQRKQITVRVNRPDLFVQARGSYIAGAQSAK